MTLLYFLLLYTSSCLHAGLPVSVRKISAVRRKLLQMPTAHWPTLQQTLPSWLCVDRAAVLKLSKGQASPAHPATSATPEATSALTCHSCFRLYWIIPNSIDMCCFSLTLKQKTPIPLSWAPFTLPALAYFFAPLCSKTSQQEFSVLNVSGSFLLSQVHNPSCQRLFWWRLRSLLHCLFSFVWNVFSQISVWPHP